MPVSSRLGRLAGRPVLVSELHARMMLTTSRRVLDTEAEDGGLLASLRRLLPGVGAGARRARGEDDKADLPETDLKAGLWGGGVPPCAPDAECMRGWWMQDGAAIIDIDGPLWDRGFGWGDGYDDIARALRAAREDDRVDAILLRITSPGGLVDGLFDLVSEISEGSARKGGKPIWAFVAGSAFSAAYAIAAACDRIISSPEGEVGSIGAVLIHVSEEGWLKDHGIEVTPIEFPEGKTEGAGFKALSDEARADLSHRIKRAATLFIDHVAAHRPLDAEAILALRARVFAATDPDPERSALELGLIDGVMYEREILTALASGEGEPAQTAKTVSAPNAEDSRTAGTRDDHAAHQTQAETPMNHAKKVAALKARAKAGDEDAKRQLAALETMLEGVETDEEEMETEEETVASEDGDVEAEQETEEDAKASANAVIAMMTSKEAQANPTLAGILAGTPGMTLSKFKAALNAAKAGARQTFAAPDPAIEPDGAGDVKAGPTGNKHADQALAALRKMRPAAAFR
jgi:ClpP class serine protease